MQFQAQEWKNVVEGFLSLKSDLRNWNVQLQRVEAALTGKCRAGDLVIAGHTLEVRWRNVNGEWVETLIIDGELQ